MFLDLFPGEHESLGINVLCAFHFVLAHTFVPCQQEQSKWDLRFMDLEWLKKHLKAVPDAIAHEVMTVNKENQFVITAGTHELQKFVVKHVNTLGAYEKPLHKGDFFSQTPLQYVAKKSRRHPAGESVRAIVRRR